VAHTVLIVDVDHEALNTMCGVLLVVHRRALKLSFLKPDALVTAPDRCRAAPLGAPPRRGPTLGMAQGVLLDVSDGGLRTRMSQPLEDSMPETAASGAARARAYRSRPADMGP
jgi:hypothetical protein